MGRGRLLIMNVWHAGSGGWGRKGEEKRGTNPVKVCRVESMPALYFHEVTAFSTRQVCRVEKRSRVRDSDGEARFPQGAAVPRQPPESSELCAFIHGENTVAQGERIGGTGLV